jgi:hypothetical protein
MKKLLLFLWLGSEVIGAYAQKEDFTDNKTDKEFKHQQEIEKRKTETETNAKIVDQIVNNRKFILKPVSVTYGNNTKYNLSGQLSYIAVDSNNITVELESIPDYFPYWGVVGINPEPWYGGVLITGTISLFEEKKQEKADKGYSIHLIINTILGHRISIFLQVSPNANANATINELNLRYTGSLTLLEKDFIPKQNSFF